MNPNEGLISEIFNSMNFKPESTFENDSTGENDDLREIFKSDKIPKTFTDAVNKAAEAQINWNKLSALRRSDLLHMVWKEIKNKSAAMAKLQYNLSLLADYFDLYSDMAVKVGKIPAEPVGVVLVVLPPDPCSFIIGATVSAALAAGCTVVLHTEQATFPLFLEEILTKAGLPSGVLNIVTEPLSNYDKISKNIQKTIYCGSFSAAQDFYSGKIFKSFNFFCPNNTSALILESCDINAAVSNIIQKTWADASFWAVSTVVVQESIHMKFLDLLRFQIRQLLNANITTLKFKCRKILEKMHSVILEIIKADATDVKILHKENEQMPTTVVNDQDEKEDLPLLNILICRTSKEGVMLLNNCYSAFATSIWSECSAQALEIASQLESPNIWINCHGVVEASVPHSLNHLSGNMVFGGRQGILEYLSTGERQVPRSVGACEKASRKSEALQAVYSAVKAMHSWGANKNKKKYLKILADYLESNEKLSEEAENVKYLSCFTNHCDQNEKNSTEEFFIVYEKIPIGVIGLFISCETDTKTLSFLITLPIALGNAVILVMEDQSTFVSRLIDFFDQKVQKNLLTAVYGKDAGLYLASDPNVQALWLYDENVSTVEELRKESATNLKHLWVIPKIKNLNDVLVMQCMRPKTIWLPKVEKFP